jgi:hypothetical protein
METTQHNIKNATQLCSKRSKHTYDAIPVQAEATRDMPTFVVQQKIAVTMVTAIKSVASMAGKRNMSLRQ